MSAFPESRSNQRNRSVSFWQTPDAGCRKHHRRQLRQHRHASGAEGTNNSMPLADKNYTAPEPPLSCEAYTSGLTETAISYREKLRPMRRNYVTLFFRVRKQNYEPLLWQCIVSGIIPKDSIYLPKYLPHWTIGIRIRVLNCYPLGSVIESMKHRLGITHPNFRLCLDGFFGMINYTDVFKNPDACPWMSVSKNSTALSLRLRDGDSLFISIATIGQIENVEKYRKKKSLEIGAPRSTAVGNTAPRLVRLSNASWGRSSRPSTSRQLPFPALVS